MAGDALDLGAEHGVGGALREVALGVEQEAIEEYGDWIKWLAAEPFGARSALRIRHALDMPIPPSVLAIIHAAHGEVVF